MPRKSREKSMTGIYHIMLRGIDRREIFLDDDDKRKFIDTLHQTKESGGFHLYGYCLMDNHVHLLIQEGEDIGTSIKRIAVSYAQWHNNKYARFGHLFQNRYRSEAVDTERYFHSVLRYIHQNPVRAMMSKTCKDYLWSSYNSYMESYSTKSHNKGNGILDIDTAIGYFEEIEEFEKFMNEKGEDKYKFLEYEEKVKYTDADLLSKINEYRKKDYQGANKSQEDLIIKKIYKDTGVSIRQLSRVLGVGKGVIERIVKRS